MKSLYCPWGAKDLLAVRGTPTTWGSHLFENQMPGQRMTLVTRLNGVEMQRATTDMLIHSIPRQIAYISTFTPLEAGDVIVTGTPGGVGAKRTPPLFMKAGDIVEVDVDAIGTLRNVIREE